MPQTVAQMILGLIGLCVLMFGSLLISESYKYTKLKWRILWVTTAVFVLPILCTLFSAALLG